MDLSQLIEALADASAYPNPGGAAVEVRQTHISAVFLVGTHAYKIKKPVDLGFLDFSTLEKRRHFCEEEVRLNRRLAPSVYLGVVPVTLTPRGVRMEGPGEAVEWAVKMERLPQDASLEQRLLRDESRREHVEALARKVASFHAHADRGERVSAFGRFETVARNALENFEQAAALVGTTLSRSVFERLGTLTEQTLTRLHPVIEGRAQRGVPRDTHGDLHLDHVYLFPDREPPADLVIIDCIEFNERFRFADPVADMAFLAMDLCFHGRRDLARVFAQEYFRAAGDEEGRGLLDFYMAYRAAVRGKVEGLRFLEKEIPQTERGAALASARAHWLLALGELETPDRRPCLVLVGGLPGAGKSTLAQSLAERADFHLIRADLVRKELAGLSAPTSASASFGEGIYTSEWNERTYAECLSRAEALLFEGHRVVVDASFREDQRRRDFLKAAARLGVRAVFLLCQAAPDVVHERLLRRRGDASDAGPSIHHAVRERWEEVSPTTRPFLMEVSSAGTKEDALAQALHLLAAAGDSQMSRSKE